MCIRVTGAYLVLVDERGEMLRTRNTTFLLELIIQAAAVESMTPILAPSLIVRAVQLEVSSTAQNARRTIWDLLRRAPSIVRTHGVKTTTFDSSLPGISVAA